MKTCKQKLRASALPQPQFKISGTVCLVLVITIALCLGPAEAMAQGSIFGAVTGVSGGAPADGGVSFVGFLDGSDEEIRLEGCVGASYGEGFWLDDFQNFLTEAPGLPYEYHFFAAIGSEGFVLNGLIPDNSYQQEDIDLVSVSWPAVPEAFNGYMIGTEVRLSWNYAPGNSYHIYRRQAPSGGSFFRVDVGPGETGNPGVNDSAFVDPEIEPTSTYDYVVVAEDGLGILGPHSAVLTVAPGGACCQIRGDVDNSGSEVIDISDLITLVEFMFQGGPEPLCMEQANVNGQDGSAPDIGDLIFLVSYMFQSGPPPPPCA